MDKYDVVVVGSGTGGQTAAYELQAQGLKTAVAERSDRPGGVCALYGCQPKKWFYEVTEIIARSKHLQGKGIVAEPQSLWSAIRAQKNQFTARIPEGTLNGLKKADIDFLPGDARFLDHETLEVGAKKLKAKFYLLATGAAPMPLPIAGRENLITSDDFLELEMLPRRILFVGGGFISFEFAHFAARLGPPNSRNIILEVRDRPLDPFDEEMVGLLVDASRAEGIEVHTNIEIAAITQRSAEFLVTTASGQTFAADLVVHGAGREPNRAGLGLEAGGIESSARGITVDTRMRTSNPQVFAVGDCAATVQLARVADYEAHIAAQNILAELRHTAPAQINYAAVPSMLFTYPQYGMVGQTEKALQQHGVAYRRSFAKNLQWPTYRRVGLQHAAYKILVGPDNRILGVHLLSDNASGLINTLKQAMLNGTPADELYWQSIMSPYPTRESDLTYMLQPFLS
ncbi:MAG: NAD(P)/FAD-dependent oxidoreductase [Desulfobacterales bacterium]|nr:MAG: NAD(P)/FAD-dependent oxidoreductase [Desulfobacterales bacterium]